MSYRIEKWTQIYAPNAAMLRYMLVSEGYQVSQWCDMPNAVRGNRKHDKDQSHWIISGTLELTVERVGTFILEAGDRDFLPADSYYSVRVIGEEQVLYLVGEKI